MTSSEVRIDGLAELQKALDTFAVNVQKKVMRGALRAGQKVILDQARANVPVASGDLRKSLRISTRMKGAMATATLKAGSKKAFYAQMVEFGTAAHLIKPKNARALFFFGNASAAINHPGSKKKPFMRPAFDARAQASIEAFADYVRKRLAKETAKQLAALPDERDAG